MLFLYTGEEPSRIRREHNDQPERCLGCRLDRLSLDTEVRAQPSISNFRLQQRMGAFCIRHPELPYHSSEEASLPSTLLQKPLESLSPCNPETTVEPERTATLAGGEESKSKEERRGLEAASGLCCPS